MRRTGGILLVGALIVASCTATDDRAGDDAAAPSESSTDTPTVASTTVVVDAETADSSPLVPFADLPVAEVDADLRADLVAALEGAGVLIVDEPNPGAQQYEVLTSQIDDMVIEIEQGGGIPGAQLDAAAPGEGAVPASALLAAYVVSGDTPGADLARRWVDVDSVSDPTALTFPRAVIVLLTADVISTGLEELGVDPVGITPGYADGDVQGLVAAPSAFAARSLTAAPALPAPTCSAVAGWVESVISWVFDKLTITTSGEGFTGILATIWNTAVGFVEQAVRDAITNVTAPVIGAVRGVLGTLATIGQVVGVFHTWRMEIEGSPGSVRYGVREPGETGEFVATPVELPELPDVLEDCLRTFDVPDPTDVEGFPVDWEISGIPDFAERVRADDALTADRDATLEFRANTESDDRGEEETWSLSPSITVQREDIRRFERQALDLALSWIPESPVTPFARDLIATVTQPVLDQIAEMNDARGGGRSVLVVRHLPCVQQDPVLYDGRWTGPLTFDYSGLGPNFVADYVGEGEMELTVVDGQIVEGTMSFRLDLTGGQATSGTTTITYDSFVATGGGTVGGTAARPVITGSVSVDGQVTASDPSFGEIEVPPFSYTGPPNPVDVTLRDVTCDDATGDFIPGINAAIEANGGDGLLAAGTATWSGTWERPEG